MERTWCRFSPRIAAASTVWSEVQASDIPKRANEIADEIAQVAPTFVGMQEVARWSTGSTPDASAVQYDFLDSIMKRLAADGAHYAVVTSHDDLDQSVPLNYTYTSWVRLLDRDALIARTYLPAADLKIANVRSQTYTALLSLPVPGLGTISVPRSWISADVKVRGKTFRLITTHLETYSSAVQEAQGAELLAGPAATALPIVMIGDYNSSASGTGPDTTPTYGDLISAGFDDAWSETNPALEGNTCCQDADLGNAVTNLYERIDLILTKNGVTAKSTELINSEASAAPYRPSDHAGLTGTLQISTK
ncbi:MAG TPA: endonuclease/exonuclease/phosphatase family protein [Candidatus Binataceae bacterium]|nr:endonuclease/exonuclease/phosphatase family protein [Candidatus Binataceae bacterium]